MSNYIELQEDHLVERFVYEYAIGAGNYANLVKRNYFACGIGRKQYHCMDGFFG